MSWFPASVHPSKLDPQWDDSWMDDVEEEDQ